MQTYALMLKHLAGLDPFRLTVLVWFTGILIYGISHTAFIRLRKRGSS